MKLYVFSFIFYISSLQIKFMKIKFGSTDYAAFRDNFSRSSTPTTHSSCSQTWHNPCIRIAPSLSLPWTAPCHPQTSAFPAPSVIQKRQAQPSKSARATKQKKKEKLKKKQRDRDIRVRDHGVAFWRMHGHDRGVARESEYFSALNPRCIITTLQACWDCCQS